MLHMLYYSYTDRATSIAIEILTTIHSEQQVYDYHTEV